MANTYLYFCDGAACNDLDKKNKKCFCLKNGTCCHTIDKNHSLKQDKIKTTFVRITPVNEKNSIFIEAINEIPNLVVINRE